jgi:hypothetical protein
MLGRRMRPISENAGAGPLHLGIGKGATTA